MPVTLDMMEYPTDVLAQEAYVSSGEYSSDKIPTMTSNTEPSGVASADVIFMAGYEAYKAMDDYNVGEKCWHTDNSDYPHWLQYQFTSGKVIQTYTVTSRDYPGENIWYPIDWKLQGSNNGTDWIDLDTRSGESFTQNEKKTYSFNNSTSYTYYRILITKSDRWDEGFHYVAIGEIELMELSLQCYSESTIITQGTYSLKGFARATDSLNDTLTRIIVSPIDLTDLTKIKLDVRASRTGTNIKARIRDSGGTWSEYSIAIISANTFETKEWDISAISNPNKDAIDRIQFQIIEASGDNIFYLDNMFANWWAKIFTEQIVLSDSFSRRWTIYRTFTETLHLTDSVSKKVGKIFSEAITLTDTIKKKVGKVFTENISLTDTFSRVWHIYRTFTENISLTDTISKKISKIFTETLHLQDTFSRVWTIYRTFTEKISLTDKVKLVKTNLVNLIKKLLHLEDIED